MPDTLGDTIGQYADQVADLNATIKSYYDAGNPERAQVYKDRRAALASKVDELNSKAKSAGAAPIDFAAEVRKRAPPDYYARNHDTVQPDAPEQSRGFVAPSAPDQLLDRKQAANADPRADLNKDGKLTSEELNRSEGLPARKDDASANPKLAVLAELDKRGALPDKYRAVFDELKKRGVVPNASGSYPGQQSQTVADAKIANEDAGEKVDRGSQAAMRGGQPGQTDLPDASAKAKEGATPDETNPKIAFDRMKAREAELRAAAHRQAVQEGSTSDEAATAKSEVDFAKDPEWVELRKKVAGLESQMYQSGAGIMVPTAPGAEAARGVVQSAKSLPGLVRDVTGATAKTAAQDAKSAVVKEAVGTIKGAEGEAAALTEKQAADEAAAKATQAKIKAGAPTAEARATQKTAPPRVGGPGQEQKAVLTKTQEAARAAGRDATAAAQDTESARTGSEATGTAIEEAKKAATKLDEELAAKPSVTREEFGERLETAVRDTNTKLKKARSAGSDYAGVLVRAGDKPSIGTQDIADRIDVLSKDIRNKTTRQQLDTLKKELETVAGGQSDYKLNLKQADSLRKNVAESIDNKLYDGEATSKEALSALKEVRKMLTKAATDAHPEYKEALGKFSTLSRPLAFIEKNAALRKVVADNPAAEEAAVTRSQIVGTLVRQANTADRKALARLVTESPELRNAARLYFTGDLFAKGPVTESTLKTWLKTNRPALQQLGIEGEFRSMQAAKKTAQEAVDRATGALKESKQTLEKAKAKETAIQDRLKAAESLRDAARKRLGLTEKTKPSADELKSGAAARRSDAVERVGREADKRSVDTGKSLTAKQGEIKEYRELLSDLSKAEPKDAMKQAQKVVDKLRDKMTPSQHSKLTDVIAEAGQKTQSAAKLRKQLGHILQNAILLYGGYEAFRFARGVM